MGLSDRTCTREMGLSGRFGYITKLGLPFFSLLIGLCGNIGIASVTGRLESMRGLAGGNHLFSPEYSARVLIRNGCASDVGA